MPEMKVEPSIKNKKAIDVSKKMGRRYSLLDAMMMGRRLGIDWKKEKFTVGDLLVGMHYELEHGKVDPETNVTNDSPKKTAKIAWAHLKERPDYYVQLMKMDPPHKLEKKASESSPVKKVFKNYADILTGKNMKRSAGKRELAKILLENKAKFHDARYDAALNSIDKNNNPDILQRLEEIERASRRASYHSDASTRSRLKAFDIPSGPEAKERLKTYGTRAATAAAIYGAYRGAKALINKYKHKRTEKEKTALECLDEMVKEAAATLNFSQQYTPKDTSGQFVSEMKNKSDSFMSAIKNQQTMQRSTEDHLSDVIENARRATYDKATNHNSPEYKAVRNHKLTIDKVNRKTDSARAKINETYQDALKKTDYDNQGGSGLGSKALLAAGITAAGIGAYKAYRKHKENKQAQQTPVYPQSYSVYPQMMQHTASSLLDALYFEKIADTSEEIPDLISEAKYKPEIKKEKTPGGKITPSKYVQRKNKQRYNA